MKIRGICTILLACTGAAWGGGASAVEDLSRAYPGVQTLQDGARVRYVYGVPMNAAATAQEAASAWVQGHLGVFDAAGADLVQVWSAQTGSGRHTVFAYNQFIDGMPVEHGLARVVVLNATNQVVYVGATLAPTNKALPAIQVDSAMALELAKLDEGMDHLTTWGEPELVVWQGEGEWQEPVPAWRVVGEVPDLDHRHKHSFFISAVDGSTLFVRDEVLHIDVSGTTKAWGSPGMLPFMASNPNALMMLPEIRVTITGGGNAFSDVNGIFTVPHGGTTQVAISTTLDNGRWVNVNDQAGNAILNQQLNVIPPGPADFELNAPGANEQLTAQVNAFIHTIGTHNYFKDRAPSFTALDTVLPANVNLAQTCNAFYDGSSINFYRSGGGCNNTSYSSVVAHEYGHHIVNRLGLGQGGFGEGYSDVISELQFDDPIIGRFFQTNGGFVRHPDAANQQYPCSSTAVHTCGQILGGMWWEIRKNFGTKYGSGPGLTQTQQLQVDWSLITTGGAGSNFLNSAHPGTAIEVLTVDDNDGNINNGTPNRSEICAAFGAHSIQCPQLQLIAFEYPNGLPVLVGPTQASKVKFNVVGVGGTPTPGTGEFRYSVNNGAFQQGAVSQLAPNQYEATFPTAACGALVRYYFSAQASGGQTQTDPATAPAASYSATSATGQVVVFEDDFQTHKGWTGGVAGDTATTGIWNRMAPQQTSTGGQTVQPGSDHTPGAGTMCWVTDGLAGSSVGDRDVDNGRTTLLSPAFDFSGLGSVKISYWRWYTNSLGGAPNADTFRVDISNNGGASWVNVETVGPSGPQTSGGWFSHEFYAETKVALTNNMRLRFIAEDIATGSLVEACVDDFQAVAFECVSCAPDLDGDGDLDVFDFLEFQNLFANQDPIADWEQDGDWDIFDFLAYQSAYAQGC